MGRIITPKEMESDLSDLNKVIDEFHDKLLLCDKGSSHYHVVIRGEYPRIICNKIEALYANAGWATVICKTSSESGERPGLTGLQLII